MACRFVRRDAIDDLLRVGRSLARRSLWLPQLCQAQAAVAIRASNALLGLRGRLRRLFRRVLVAL